jgi:hypothetical protein
MVGAMGMREDCRHYESRTYGSGDIVRMCRLDLAPDAPWKCPDDCPKYEYRGFDAGWTVGSLTKNRQPAEPPPAIDESVAGLLDQAEDIINAVGDEILAEVREERDQQRRPKRPWDRFRKKGR